MPPPSVGPNDAILREKQYLEKGWEADAYATLDRFLEARRPAGKAAYSINGSSLLGHMESFYQSAAIDDSNTPAEAFSVFPLSMQDRERGIFMLIFDQPPVFEIDFEFVVVDSVDQLFHVPGEAPKQAKIALHRPEGLFGKAGRGHERAPRAGRCAALSRYG